MIDRNQREQNSEILKNIMRSIGIDPHSYDEEGCNLAQEVAKWFIDKYDYDFNKVDLSYQTENRLIRAIIEYAKNKREIDE